MKTVSTIGLNQRLYNDRSNSTISFYCRHLFESRDETATALQIDLTILA